MELGPEQSSRRRCCVPPHDEAFASAPPDETTAAFVTMPVRSARRSNPDEDVDMPHVLIIDPASEVANQPGAVVSKVVHRGNGMNVTVFGFDASEELTEHQAARTAVFRYCSRYS